LTNGRPLATAKMSQVEATVASRYYSLKLDLPLSSDLEVSRSLTHAENCLSETTKASRHTP